MTRAAKRERSRRERKRRKKKSGGQNGRRHQVRSVHDCDD